MLLKAGVETILALIVGSLYLPRERCTSYNLTEWVEIKQKCPGLTAGATGNFFWVNWVSYVWDMADLVK